MNMFLLIIEVIISYALLLYTYKKYKENGIYMWIVISLILSCIMSSKTIEVLNVDISLGIGLSTIIYIANNILIQKKGTEHTKKIIDLIVTFGFMFILMIFVSYNAKISLLNSYTSNMFDIILQTNFKYMIATVISLICGLYINNHFYYLLRKVKNKIIISNVTSALLSNLVDVIIFVILCSLVNISLYTVIMTFIIRYIIKVLICIIGTDVIYIANNFKEG